MKVIKVLVLTLALTGLAVASEDEDGQCYSECGPITNAVPEIDGATAGSALALIAGGLVVLRARRK